MKTRDQCVCGSGSPNAFFQRLFNGFFVRAAERTFVDQLDPNCDSANRPRDDRVSSRDKNDEKQRDRSDFVRLFCVSIRHSELRCNLKTQICECCRRPIHASLFLPVVHSFGKIGGSCGETTAANAHIGGELFRHRRYPLSGGFIMARARARARSGVEIGFLHADRNILFFRGAAPRWY